MKPRWRWWLFCASFDLSWRFGWDWLRPVWMWASSDPSWWTLGADCSGGTGEEPF